MLVLLLHIYFICLPTIYIIDGHKIQKLIVISNRNVQNIAQRERKDRNNVWNMDDDVIERRRTGSKKIHELLENK